MAYLDVRLRVLVRQIRSSRCTPGRDPGPIAPRLGADKVIDRTVGLEHRLGLADIFAVVGREYLDDAVRVRD